MTRWTCTAWLLVGLLSILAMGMGTSLGWYGRPLVVDAWHDVRGEPTWFGPPPSLLVFCTWVWALAARVASRIIQKLGLSDGS